MENIEGGNIIKSSDYIKLFYNKNWDFNINIDDNQIDLVYKIDKNDIDEILEISKICETIKISYLFLLGNNNEKITLYDCVIYSNGYANEHYKISLFFHSIIIGEHICSLSEIKPEMLDYEIGSSPSPLLGFNIPIGNINIDNVNVNITKKIIKL